MEIRGEIWSLIAHLIMLVIVAVARNGHNLLGKVDACIHFPHSDANMVMGGSYLNVYPNIIFIFNQFQMFTDTDTATSGPALKGKHKLGK